jgi:hypothetical protein
MKAFRMNKCGVKPPAAAVYYPNYDIICYQGGVALQYKIFRRTTKD